MKNRKNRKKLLRNALRNSNKSRTFKIPKVKMLLIKKVMVSYIPETDTFKCLLDLIVNDRFIKCEGTLYAEYLVDGGLFVTVEKDDKLKDTIKDINCNELYVSGVDAPFLCGTVRAFIDTIGELIDMDELDYDNPLELRIIPKVPIKDKDVEKNLKLYKGGQYYEVKK